MWMRYANKVRNWNETIGANKRTAMLELEANVASNH